MSLAKTLNRSITECVNNSTKRICILQPMLAEYKAIQLQVGRNVVGRTIETGIRDIRCSKHQLQLQVDIKACKVGLKVLGVNPCGVNGLMVMQNTECNVKHGDVLEIVYGKHMYEVIFKPPPDDASTDLNCTATEAKKRKQTGESWDSTENGKMVIYSSANLEASEKIAAYDIDGTVIRTKSGNVFPKNCDDWQLNYPQVRKKLNLLNKDGYKICLFTNQGGISKGKVKLDDFKQKVRLIQKELDVPVQVFIATSDGFYRKPAPGMWQYLQEHKNEGISIKLEKSFYVGDAAGRPECGSGASKRKKDHSYVDRFFASNIGISFYTPEEHFLGTKTEHWVKPEFEPSIAVQATTTIYDPSSAAIPANNCELILLVGLPGSGKSHFANNNLQPLGYNVFNADTLGSTQACFKQCEKSLRAGKSAVVDNTNVDKNSRKKFIELSKSLQIPCRCFLMNVPVGQVKHNIAFRNLVDTEHSKINDMVLNMMKKKYEEPKVAEGFAEVVRVTPKTKFVELKHEELYKLYLVEK